MRYHPKFNGKINALAFFVVPIAILTVVDEALSFIIPITIEETTQSNLMVGVILSFSSFVGFFADYILSFVFRGISWKFQFVLAILIAITFPVANAIGISMNSLPMFFVMAFMWGIYYETRMFAEADFMIEEETNKSYAKNWGIVMSVQSIMYILGPILGGVFLLMQVWHYTSILVILLIVALTYTLVIFGFQVKDNIGVEKTAEPVGRKHRHRISWELFKEMQMWKELGRDMFPIFLLCFVLSSFDMTIYTLGGLFGTELQGDNGFQWIIALLYNFPLLLTSFFIIKMNIKKHKKHMAILSIMIGGLIMSTIGFVSFSKELVMLAIGLASIAISFAYPLTKASLSDISQRAGKFAPNITGIYNSIGSMAGMVIPIVMGFLADSFGYYVTFSVLGFAAFCLSLVLLAITPRKIRVPHKALELIEAE